MDRNKYLICKKSIKFKLENLSNKFEELGVEGVPIKKLFKKIGIPIKIPHKFLIDSFKDFQLKIVCINGINTKIMHDCLNKIEIPIIIEIWLIGILFNKSNIKNKKKEK